MSNHVYVIAELQTKPGCEKRLADSLRQLEQQTNQESGCIKYQLVRQIQHPTQPTAACKYDWTLIEEYANMEAFNEHMAQPYLQAWFAKHMEGGSDPLVGDHAVRLFTDE